MAQPQRLTGTVAWYNVDRGFGVIEGDDQQPYFAHHTLLSAGVKQLIKGERVSFLARRRPRDKVGEEAYEVGLLPQPPSPPRGPNESILDFIRRLPPPDRKSIENRAQYTPREEGARYPEICSDFERLAELLSLPVVPTDLDIVQRAFPPGTDLPRGAITRERERSDPYRRHGVYACLGDDDIVLVVHGFYENAKHELVVWRAKAYRRRSGKFYPMKNQWRERFDYFLGDAQFLISLARGRHRPHRDW